MEERKGKGVFYEQYECCMRGDIHFSIESVEEQRIEVLPLWLTCS